MKTYATKEKRAVSAVRKARPYVHHPMGPVQQVQRAEIRRILRSTGAQAKLTIGQPNDKYEQEADRVADQVMAMPDQILRRQPENEAEEETLQTKPLTEQTTPLVQTQDEISGEEELKARSMHGKTQAVTPEIESRINSLKSGGQPLDPVTSNFFEPRFGADFSKVRIHKSPLAVQLARSVNAHAFTYGNRVVFDTGRYSPQSTRGKKLLAHELTHVLQQSKQKRPASGTQQIQRYPKNTPQGRPYTPGVNHNHRPSGKWAKIKREVSCFVFRLFNLPKMVLIAAMKSYPLAGKPLAISHVKHYLSGAGKDYMENITNFINRDQGVRYNLASYIKKSTTKRGHFKVYQRDYTDQDYRYAFGAIDRLDYEVDSARGKVHVWFLDRYEFHPVYRYYKKKAGDVKRITNCVHAAAVEAQLSGARAYWIHGHGTIPLSTVKSTKKPKRGITFKI